MALPLTLRCRAVTAIVARLRVPRRRSVASPDRRCGRIRRQLMRPAAYDASHRIAVASRWERGGWASTGAAHHPDSFAVNPIRRSLVLVVVSAAAFIVPLAIGGPAAETVLLAGGWLGLLGVAIGTPVLCLSVIEEGCRRLRRRMQPPVEQLAITPRLINILRRHGYESIASIDRASDASLLLLSNMDARGVAEIRRALALWHYRQWQEHGFP